MLFANLLAALNLANVFKNKKNVWKIKNVKNVKNDQNKNVKNVFYIYDGKAPAADGVTVD